MNDRDSDQNLDEILQALAVSNIETSDKNIESPSSEKYTMLSEEDEIAKTIQELDSLIKTNAEILEEARQLVKSTGDVEMIEAYSSLGKAQSEAFKNKVKLLMERQKNKIVKETKEKETFVKEKLVDFTISQGNEKAISAPSTLNQTNIIMSGTREEMFEMILKKKEKELLTIDLESQIKP